MGPDRAAERAWRCIADVVDEIRRDHLLDVAAYEDDHPNAHADAGHGTRRSA